MDGIIGRGRCGYGTYTPYAALGPGGADGALHGLLRIVMSHNIGTYKQL